MDTNKTKTLIDYQSQFVGHKQKCSKMSREEIIELIKEDGSNIKYIDNPDEELQFLAIRSPKKKNTKGFNISYIKNPTYNVCQEFLFKNINIKDFRSYQIFYLAYNHELRSKGLLAFINPECDCFEEIEQLYEFLKK